MKRLVEFPLEDGSVMLVETEVEGDFEGELVPASQNGRIDNIPEKAAVTFQEAIDKVKPGAELIIKKLRKLSDPPDEIQVAFGLKLNAIAGAIIASTGIEANYTITLKWTKGK